MNHQRNLQLDQNMLKQSDPLFQHFFFFEYMQCKLAVVE